MSNGANAICWGEAGGPAATPAVSGTVFGCTANDTGQNNTFIGQNAGLGSTSESYSNTAVGVDAMRCDSTSFNNSAFGWCSMRNITEGGNNVGFGSSTLRALTIGNNNVAVGTNSLTAVTTGAANVAVGRTALRDTTGSFNVAVGNNSLNVLVAGSCNVAIGSSAGVSLTEGSFNVLIGNSVNPSGSTANCCLMIGYASGCNWLTGDSNKHIRPGAGIRDTAGNLGTNGQVLTSTGTAVQWRNLPSIPAIRSNTVNYTTSSTPFGAVTICYNNAINDTTGWYNGSTGVFQPNIAGYYQLNASARIFTGTGTEVGMWFSCNGNLFSGNGGFSMTQGSISSLVYMNGTTDALCVQMFSSVTSCTISWNVLNRFSAQLTALA
jgi:hypothetical protein